MDVRLLGFGAIEVDGQRYEHDILVEGGRVRKRKKGPSKPYRDEFGHTPLSVDEDLPWGGSSLIIGTGVWMALDARLPMLRTPWILWSLVLFGISGALFGARVAPLQKKMLANVRAGIPGQWNEAEYHSLSRSWQLWGIIATGTPVIALFLMVLKPTW